MNGEDYLDKCARLCFIFMFFTAGLLGLGISGLLLLTVISGFIKVFTGV